MGTHGYATPEYVATVAESPNPHYSVILNSNSTSPLQHNNQNSNEEDDDTHINLLTLPPYSSSSPSPPSFQLFCKTDLQMLPVLALHFWVSLNFSCHGGTTRSVNKELCFGFNWAPRKWAVGLGLRIGRVNHGYDEEEETSDSSKLRILKQKVEGLEINCDSYGPGRNEVLVCPKDRFKSNAWNTTLDTTLDFATWKCSSVECVWAGQVLAEDIASCNRVKVNCTGLMTVESLRLVPVGEKLISYFAGRKISEDVLRRNAVMQISGNQNAIAFTYRRNEVLVTCKYRSLDKKFWQRNRISDGLHGFKGFLTVPSGEALRVAVVIYVLLREKCKERIFYGLDDIKGADEIIVVEGEIDKLSMEEAGFLNCVSVPDGAPAKVSAKLPSLEKDSRFQYLWNCKEHLDKASRIILATDGDPPGNALAEELARRLGRERCWRVCWPKKGEFSYYKDANEVLMNLGSASLRDVVHSAELYSMHN
ncbi:hypothetical protein RHMOL_Rhmol13G0164800 [Rhododendron molle]|uniref:Uncharacterized protein n=2 Tax=Rhododendron molle TaxID=49168 RepID=A0ACC0L7W6_RHOML|nr:hypothetical protein RHMOL_Rhmol13G0164800 [Rhododendron molle]KAI8524649.1 hypothetical protein RHMOL_Rhmol13G0164800 [Rhododendron molle]